MSKYNSVVVDDEGKVFDSCEALFIYPNVGGNVSIRQFSAISGDDVVIEVPLHFIEKTISALRFAKREAEDLKDA